MTDRDRNLPCHVRAVPPGCRPTLVALAVAAALGSASAWAEPMLQAALNRQADMSRWTDNYVELGVGWNSDDSFKFGEFSGLSERGAFPIVGFDWRWNDRDDDARHLQVHAANLGLDTRKLGLRAGDHGRWGVSFSADRLVRAEVDSARFIHRGLGSSTLTLPPGFAGIGGGAGTAATGDDSQPSNPDNAAAINGALKPYSVAQGRDIYRLGTNFTFGKHWDLRVDYREDRRDGSRLTGAAFGTNGGNPRSVIVPYQIDDHTRQIEMLLSYATQRAQMQLGYSYSRFDNELDALRWENPFARVGNWPADPNGASVGSPGALSLMPSNEHHQVTASGGFNLSRRARLAAQLSYGVARQNEAFLPYTSNPAVSVAEGLPRGSLDGKVVNTLADIGLTAQPLDRLSVKLGYQYRDSDNRTPSAQYRYVVLDTANQPAQDANSAAIRTNVAVSSTEHKFVADADYQLLDRTHLRGVWERRELDYQNADVRSATENKGSLELRRVISSDFTGVVGVSRKERRGSLYDKNQFFRASFTTGSAAFAAATPFDNNPQIRQFLYADYDENRARASGNWIASETVSVQGSIDWYRRKYRGSNCTDPQVVADPGLTWPDECLGRKANDGMTATVDVQWQPDEQLTAFAYYTYARSSVDQVGRSYAANALLAQVDDPQRDFFVTSDFRDHALGLGVKWQPTALWDLGGQLVYSRGSSEIDVTKAAGLATVSLAPVPDADTTLGAFQLFAKWAYDKRTTVRFNYTYENRRTDDWAYAFGVPTGSANVLLTGQLSPRYVNHVIGCSVAITTW